MCDTEHMFTCPSGGIHAYSVNKRSNQMKVNISRISGICQGQAGYLAYKTTCSPIPPEISDRTLQHKQEEQPDAGKYQPDIRYLSGSSWVSGLQDYNVHLSLRRYTPVQCNMNKGSNQMQVNISRISGICQGLAGYLVEEAMFSGTLRIRYPLSIVNGNIVKWEHSYFNILLYVQVVVTYFI